jgi:hypothetical protein
LCLIRYGLLHLLPCFSTHEVFEVWYRRLPGSLYSAYEVLLLCTSHNAYRGHYEQYHKTTYQPFVDDDTVHFLSPMMVFYEAALDT